MKKLVAEITEGIITIHARNINCSNDADTYCGLDIGRGNTDTEPHKLPKNKGINCQACYNNWVNSHHFNRNDFDLVCGILQKQKDTPTD